MYKKTNVMNMYKDFLVNSITRYNGQWYCYLCKSMLQSSANAERHSQEVHPDTSTQISDFLNKSIKLSCEKCRKLVNHGIVIRDALQDYFCVPCQCSKLTLDHIDKHIMGKNHQKCIKVSTIMEDSTNDQQNSNDNRNSFKSNETIVNTYVPYPPKFQIYKRLLEQRITRYNGQWYCCLCTSMLQSLENAECHSQEAHPGFSTHMVDFLDKSLKLSETKCKELLNHGIIIIGPPQYYFCVPCQCLLPGLDHINQHTTGRKHQECIKASTISEDSTNDQQNSNDSKNNETDVSVDVDISPELRNKSKLSTKVQPICENESVKELSNGFTANETIVNTYVPCSRESEMYKRFLVQRITRYNGQWYCYLCKSTLESLANAERHSEETHPDISIQRADFLNKMVELSNTKCRKLLNHGIIIKDLPQDYFCVPCQCSIPSLGNIGQHTTGKKHQKCIKINAVPKDSTNDQQNSNNNKSNKNVSVRLETALELLNKSKLSTKVQPICENESVKKLSNGFTANETIVNTYVPCSRKSEMYKRFLVQRITRYNGQWYCYLCKSMLESLANAERHLQETHSDINIQIADFLDKMIELSNTKCRKLLNHGIIIKDLPQDYFCVPCQCSIPTLGNIGQHTTGKKHQKCIKINAVPKDSTNDQQNSNNNKSNKNVSVCLETALELLNKSKLSTKVQPICENESVKKLSNGFTANETIVNTYVPCSRKSEMYKRFLVQRITRYNGQWYCYLCKSMLESLANAERHLQETHSDINIQIADFLDKMVELSNTKCRKLLNHGIIIKDLPQDYFCVPCQCSIPTLGNIGQHTTGKKHQKCIKINAVPKDSTNDQQNSNNNKSNKNVSVRLETALELLNKSKLSTKVQPICENESVKKLSNGFTANETIVNTYVPCSRKSEMYKRFLVQRITRYNGQWYCYLCKSTLESLANAERHSEETHPDISIQRADFLNKMVELSNTKCRKLLNHGIIIKDLPQDYFCVPCQCSIPSLGNIGQHTTGKKHQKCIKINAVPKDSTNDQQNSNNNKSNKNVSVRLETALELLNKSKLSTKVQPICENESVKKLSNGFTANETIVNTYVPCSRKSEMYKRFLVQRITRYNGQWYCYLCKSTLESLANAERHSEETHPDISIQRADFLNKMVELSNTKCRKLLNHGIIIKDLPQDYFCVPCQCSIPSLGNIGQHTTGKKHQKCIKINAVPKDSTNDQQNSNNNKSNKNVSVRLETALELLNKSKLSTKVQPICENESVKKLSNGFTANETIVNTYVPCSRKSEMYKRFLVQRITRYNGQWYCYLCKSILESLANAERHSQETHPDISTQRADFLNKMVELSNTKCRKLLNHGIIIKDLLQDYFCVPCHCSVPTLDHIGQHIIGKKHQQCIKACTVPEDSTKNDQGNPNNNKNSKKNNVSVIIEIPEKYANDAKLLTEMQLICENGLRKDLSDVCKTEKKNIVSFTPYKKDSNSSNILQIERCANMIFYSLCDEFIVKTCIECHLLGKKHISLISALKIFNEQAINCKCIIRFEDKREIIELLQLNSTKLDGTIWPEYNTEITAKYMCAHYNKIIENNDIMNYEITIHKNSMTSFRRYVNDCSSMNKNITLSCSYIMFKCSFCNEIMHGILLLRIHFFKCQHKNNIALLTKIEEQDYDICENVQNYFEPLEFLSLISFEKNEKTAKIMELVICIKNHHTTFQKNLDNSVQQKFIYACTACQCIFHETQTIIDHLSKKKTHLKHFQNVILTYDYMYDAPISNEFNIKETQAVKSPICTKDMSINTMEEYNINETQVNAGQNYISKLITIANIGSKDDTLYQNGENNSELFMSPDISKEINKIIKMLPAKKLAKFPQARQNINSMSVLEHYNRMYQKKYLDFEEIMFSCSQKKLKEIKSNLQFYVPYFNAKRMLCLVCNVTHSFDIHSLYEHIHCEHHITQLQKNNGDFKLNLLKELIKIEPLKIDLINAKCYACDSNAKLMYRNKSRIKDHIYIPSHKKNRRKLFEELENILKEFKTLWYSIGYFACVACNMRFKMKIEFMQHLNEKHKAVLSTRNNSKFDFCITCSTLWYKDTNLITTYQLHCQKEMHQYLARCNDFAVRSLPQTLQKLLQNIDKTIADLLKLSNDVLNDPKSIQLTDALKHTFETYPFSVKVCMFGSRVTGLGLPNSDIDIYLSFGDECIEDTLIQSRSKEIQRYLHSDRKNWKIESVLDKSRTPVINVKHRLTGLECDISFMNGLSVENSKFIKSFIMAYPPCRKLILFLRKWMSLGNLTGFNGISNYALAWLVIFYLQIEYKIPSVAALIENHDQSKIVSGWETGVGDTIHINIPELSIHQLLLGFFKYYGDFDYMHCVVCPLLGITCYKESFTEISLKKVSILPNSMTHYTAQLRTEKPEYFRVDSPMCIQDPFDLSHNLTKAVSILTLKCFRQYCNESASILRAIVTTSTKKK